MEYFFLSLRRFCLSNSIIFSGIKKAGYRNGSLLLTQNVSKISFFRGKIIDKKIGSSIIISIIIIIIFSTSCQRRDAT